MYTLCVCVCVFCRCNLASRAPRKVNLAHSVLRRGLLHLKFSGKRKKLSPTGTVRGSNLGEGRIRCHRGTTNDSWREIARGKEVKKVKKKIKKRSNGKEMKKEGKWLAEV